MFKTGLLLSTVVHVLAAAALLVLPLRQIQTVSTEAEVGVSVVATEIRFHADPVASSLPTPRSKEIQTRTELPTRDEPTVDLFEKNPTEPRLDLPDPKPFREQLPEAELPRRVRFGSALKIKAPRPEQTTHTTEVTSNCEPPSNPSPIQGVNKPPAYPRVARIRAWEGTVTLAIEVKEDGTTGHIRVEESSGYQVFDDAAVEAARTWRFNPARNNGKAAGSTLTMKIEFKLTEENK